MNVKKTRVFDKSKQKRHVFTFLMKLDENRRCVLPVKALLVLHRGLGHLDGTWVVHNVLVEVQKFQLIRFQVLRLAHIQPVFTILKLDHRSVTTITDGLVVIDHEAFKQFDEATLQISRSGRFHGSIDQA